MIFLTFLACFHAPIAYPELNSMCISGLKEELVDKGECQVMTTASPDYPGSILEPVNCNSWNIFTDKVYLLVNNDMEVYYDLDAVCMDGIVTVYSL